MFLKKIKLSNFRNFSELDIDFQKGINLITGLNGSGKTNLLESVYYCGYFRPLKSGTAKDMIKFDKECFNITIEYDSKDSTNTVNANYSIDGLRKVFFNGKKIDSVLEYIGKFITVGFGPDDLNIISNSPAYRRKFIDSVLSQTDSKYLYCLKDYKKNLKQKNYELKNEIPDRTLLKTYTEIMSEKASYIIDKRKGFIENIKKDLENHIFDISLNRENIEIFYIGNKTDYIFSGYHSDKLEKEIKFRKTLNGPHLHDIDFHFHHGSYRDFGSQGQCRSLAVALKLASIEYISMTAEVKPILLFDDIFSELDPERSEKILKIINKFDQVFIAAPKMEPFFNNINYFYVIEKDNVLKKIPV